MPLASRSLICPLDNYSGQSLSSWVLKLSRAAPVVPQPMAGGCPAYRAISPPEVLSSSSLLPGTLEALSEGLGNGRGSEQTGVTDGVNIETENVTQSCLAHPPL